MASIIIIDDMDDVREGLSAVLEADGHTVVTAADGRDGIARLQAGRFDLVITDILMPEQDGTEVIMYLETLENRPKVIAISGGAPRVPAYMALHLARIKADATLMKPFSNDELRKAVAALLGGTAA
jgi:CheY-like chemotaxis protein